MLGAIAGDIIGSVFEYRNVGNEDFELFAPRSHFTDDTVLTVAIADAILNKKNYEQELREYGLNYPNDYGVNFQKWLYSDFPKPYNSFGNGSAMRVSSVGFAFNSLEDVLREAELTAQPTHNHPEGIKGAQATAVAIFLARTGRTKQEIKKYIEDNFGYQLDGPLTKYSFDETCQKTVPQAIIAFLYSNSFEDAIRKSVSAGGDADTRGCITGGIAHAYYKKIPQFIVDKTKELLPVELLDIVNNFCNAYKIML